VRKVNADDKRQAAELIELDRRELRASRSTLARPHLASLLRRVVPGSPMSSLILKRANSSRSSGQWRNDDFDVLENGVVVGRIFFLDAVGPQGRPWNGRAGHNGDIKRAAYGYEPTREAAMPAFAKSWRPPSRFTLLNHLVGAAGCRLMCPRRPAGAA